MYICNLYKNNSVKDAKRILIIYLRVSSLMPLRDYFIYLYRVQDVVSLFIVYYH